ncbi:hypothetical protein REPUB_Repub04eG0184400 [Reevesia pubescens]
MEDVLRMPNNERLERKKIVTSKWEAPPSSSIKFNVDSAMCGISGQVGISGVLKNDEGVIKLIFSRSAGIIDLTIVEFLAIKEAFTFFAVSQWANSFGLIIESDSANVYLGQFSEVHTMKVEEALYSH